MPLFLNLSGREDRLNPMLMTTIAKTTVQRYLDAFFGEKVDFVGIRNLLSDDFKFSGPLMQANGANDYIEKLEGLWWRQLKNAGGIA